MIPISKDIQNRKQKRAAQRVARFLRLWFLFLFCLRQDKGSVNSAVTYERMKKAKKRFCILQR